MFLRGNSENSELVTLHFIQSSFVGSSFVAISLSVSLFSRENLSESALISFSKILNSSYL